MMKVFRTVIDTNVTVSALLLPRSCRAFDAALARGTLLISAATIAELDVVLRRPKFDKYVPKENRLEFLTALVQAAEQVEVTEAIAACRDVKDDKFLELAVSGRASHIVTGDGDLLALHPFRGIDVVTPQNYLLKPEREAEPGTASETLE